MSRSRVTRDNNRSDSYRTTEVGYVCVIDQTLVIDPTMESWKGKVVVITGASSGIGEYMVKELIKEGLIVVGTARRLNKLEALQGQLKDLGQFHAVKCDVTKDQEVVNAFEWIEKNVGGVDVLINNAGVSYNDSPKFITDTSTEQWQRIIDTNVIGLAVCTREALKTMRIRGDNGIIININSLAGHTLPKFYQRYPIAMYVASKHGVSGFTKCLREELDIKGSKIRVTSINPGLMHTELTDNLFEGKNDAPLSMSLDHMSDCIKFVLSMKPGAQITDLTIAPYRR